MKPKSLFLMPILLLALFSDLFSINLEENEWPDSATVNESDFSYLKEKYILDSAALSSFENSVQAFERYDKLRDPITRDIVFAGSSSIGIWNTLSADMSPLPVLGRGFGGSTILENIFYFNRIMLPYQPKICVFYCENDIGSSTQTIFELMKYYEYLFHSKFPYSELFIVSYKPSIARKKSLSHIREVNNLIKDYFESKTNTGFIDIFNPMMVTNDSVDASLFIEDNLHMNSKGYAIWTSVIKPILTETYAKYMQTGIPHKSSRKDRFAYFRNNSIYVQGVDSGQRINTYDTLGKLKESRIANGNTEEIDASKWEKGVYIIKTGNDNQSQKVQVSP